MVRLQIALVWYQHTNVGAQGPVNDSYTAAQEPEAI